MVITTKKATFTMPNSERSFVLMTTVNIGAKGEKGKNADEAVMAQDPVAYYILSKN